MELPRRTLRLTDPRLRRGHMRGFPYRARNSRAYIRGRRGGVRGQVRAIAHVRNTLRSSTRAMRGIAAMAARARARVARRRMPPPPPHLGYRLRRM